MKISELNEYIQTLAAMGAIIALAAVGYEIRQSNRIALQEATSSSWSAWMSATGDQMDSGVSVTIAKSMINPADLTLAEMIDLDMYLQQFVYGYHHDFLVLSLGERQLADAVLQDLLGDVPSIFGSRFSRAWFTENKSWMATEIAATIERGLEESVIGSGIEYYTRLEKMAAKL